MNNHKIDVYLDGHFKVQYCTVCSAEDTQLSQMCSGLPTVKHARSVATRIAQCQKEADDKLDFTKQFKEKMLKEYENYIDNQRELRE